MHRKIIKVAHTLRNNAHFELLSRFGYITSGILHGLIGLAIISLSFGERREVDQSSVLIPLVDTWHGFILLSLIVIGLTSLGVWQVARVIVMRKGTKDKEGWHTQLSELAKGIAYSVIGVTSLTYLLANKTSPSSVTSAREFAVYVLSLPAGQAFLCIVGLLILVLGANFIYRGISRRFLESLKVHEKRMKISITVLGIIGYVAKGITLIIVGILFFEAAITLNPVKASGLDGAFKLLIEFTFGELIVGILGVGFIVYAVYTMLRGKYGKL